MPSPRLPTLHASCCTPTASHDKILAPNSSRRPTSSREQLELRFYAARSFGFRELALQRDEQHHTADLRGCTRIASPVRIRAQPAWHTAFRESLRLGFS